MHLPCIRISTISKLSKPSFHLSLSTQEYQIVHPKWFLRLWCIRRKLCTYLALKLTMSTNGPKQDSIWHRSSWSSIAMHPNRFLSIWYVPWKPCTYLSLRFALSPNRSNRPSTWASSPRSIIECFRNGFRAYGALCQNHAPILHLNCLQTDWSKIPCDTHDLGVLSGASKLISKNMICSIQTVHLSFIKISTICKQTEPGFHLSLFTLEYQRELPQRFLSLWCTGHKPCNYLAPKLILSPTGRKRDSIW